MKLRVPEPGEDPVIDELVEVDITDLSTIAASAGLRTADSLEESEWETTPDGKTRCRECGATKTASAKFFIAHYKACIEPRKRGTDG